jgi:glyoxylase-like metal-dependent hydrolase (beta-lactamase superfamily II)
VRSEYLRAIPNSYHPFVTKQIAPGVHEMNVGGTSAFLLDFEGEVTLIDTGRPGNVDKIWSGLAEIGRSPEDVRNVLLTHYHIDHIGCLGPLWERTGASVYAPAGDAALIRSGGMIPQMESRGLLGAALLKFIKPAPIPAHEVDLEAADGDLLFGAEGVQVVATPGPVRGGRVLQPSRASCSPAHRRGPDTCGRELREGVAARFRSRVHRSRQQHLDRGGSALP